MPDSLPARLTASSWPRRAALPLALLALMLVFIHPYTLGRFPITSDARFHLVRLIALDHAVRHGALWPRFVPGLAYGYGVPLFNFFPPTSLYPSEALHLLGLNFVEALLWGLILYALFGAAGAYLLGKAWGGPLMGLATAAAFLYSPFMAYQFFEIASVGQVAGIALLPWVLWAFWRWAIHGQRRDLALAVATFAAVILTHNITALYTAGLLVIYGLVLSRGMNSPATARFARTKSPEGDSPAGGEKGVPEGDIVVAKPPLAGDLNPRRRLLRHGLAMVAAVGVATFFWLPSLAETRYVHIERVASAVLDVHANFRTLAQTFALPIAADPTQYRIPPIALGWPQVILAGVGIIAAASRGLKSPAKGVLASEDATKSPEGDCPPSSNSERGRGGEASSATWLLAAALLTVILVFLTTPASAWVWDHVPLMRYFQHPWRLLGPASLLLAMLAGAGIAAVARVIRRGWLRAGWITACLLAMIGYTLPWLYIEYFPQPPPARDLLDVHAFEREPPYYAGAMTQGEFIPIWMEQYPDRDALDALYAHSEVIPRLRPEEGVTVEAESWGLLRGEVTFTADETRTLHFTWAYFPGWRARIDGREVPITPAERTGLITVEVPAGRHSLTLDFGPTPLRRAAEVASLLTAMGMAGLMIFGRGLWPSRGLKSPAKGVLASSDAAKPPEGDCFPSSNSERGRGGEVSRRGVRCRGLKSPARGVLASSDAAKSPEGDSPPGRSASTGSPPLNSERGVGGEVLIATALAGLLAFGVKVGVVDADLTPLTRARFDGTSVAGVERPAPITFGGEVALLGYDLSREAVPSGGRLWITTYWHRAAPQQLTRKYVFLLSLRNPAGLPVVEAPLGPGPDLPTDIWPQGLYISERWPLDVPTGTPPGAYTLALRAHDPDAGRDLEATDPAGNPLTTYAPVGTLEVARPRWPILPDALPLDARVMAGLNEEISLMGVGPLPPSSEVGQPLLVAITWRAARQPSQDWQAQLVWGAGETSLTSPPFPLVTGYPATQWRPGDLWTGLHLLYIPGGLAEGRYTLSVVLVDEAGFSGPGAVIGLMAVGAPERIYDLPPLTHSTDLVWSNGIALAGYDLPSPTVAAGSALPLTLVWRSPGDLRQNLKVFVHLIDAGGQIVAQQDQVPAGGARPTLGWASGEVITDPYSPPVGPDVPPGEYRLRIGWYDAETGIRVGVVGGEDFAVLPTAITVTAP